MLEKVDTLEQFEQILNQNSKFFLLKHSLTCPISQAAYQEYSKFTEEHTEIPAYFLAVQEARALSNEIAERYQIKHESPQAILFSNQKPTWNTSHWKITKSSLENAAQQN